MSNKLNTLLLLAAVVIVSGCKSVSTMSQNGFSHFIGIEDFSNFTQIPDPDSGTVLLSPEIKSGIAWKELIVSWNAETPPGSIVKVEARAISRHHQTKFYTMGIWSPDDNVRTSVRHQGDNDGTVDTDTMFLKHPADAVQIRVTLSGTNAVGPKLKFVGLSFSNPLVPRPAHPESQAVWGKIIPTPERSQLAYPQEKGWCSPTSLSMVLARWSEILNRPEMTMDVPEVAAKVYDPSFAGTGNWPFNTAFAGSFEGMRGYVSRFDDITELEDWIQDGIPVVLSTRWDLLKPGRKNTGSGHLVVCIGFTKEGDVVINDPATHLDRGDSVRHIYKRADVIASWATSHNTVYIVYPIGAKLPENKYGQW